MNSCLISIIVPIYNVEAYIDRCVKSIINQTYKNLEIILVDDGSLDNCPVICDSYCRKDKRIKVIHKENGGLSDARNAGLKIATGDYVLYIDSDDYIEFDACEKLINMAITKDADIVVGVCKEICGDTVKYQKHSNLVEEKCYTSKEYIIESIKKYEWYAPAWLNLYRKEFLIRNGLFYKPKTLYEDVEIMPKLFLNANRIVYLDYPFYNYIIRTNSIMTSRISEEKVIMSLNIYKEWYDMFNCIEDEMLQRYLYGYLVRMYLGTARRLRIDGWRINGIDFKFAFKYALSFRERMKVFLFTICPQIYISF